MNFEYFFGIFLGEYLQFFIFLRVVRLIVLHKNNAVNHHEKILDNLVLAQIAQMQLIKFQNKYLHILRRQRIIK